jgi:hypothetical protein
VLEHDAAPLSAKPIGTRDAVSVGRASAFFDLTDLRRVRIDDAGLATIGAAVLQAECFKAPVLKCCFGRPAL